MIDFIQTTRRFALAGAAAVAVAFPVAGPTAFLPQAAAHDAVVGGNVTEGAVLDEFPSEIVLEFSAVPQEGFNTFAVTDKDTKEVLFTEEPVVDGRNLTIQTPQDMEFGPGDYQLGFQITSSDGHATRGGMSFAVAGEESEAAEPTTASNDAVGDASDISGLPTGAKIGIAIGSILAAAAVVAMLIAKRRNS